MLLLGRPISVISYVLLLVDKYRAVNVMDKKPNKATIYSQDVHLQSRPNSVIFCVYR